ncbi:MAG: tetratricopeptide repeat protein [Okeania sp. SIO2C2]|uniref:tetratricopeptide repeat-containing sulfotransferase family protein n=1 Tax=Okeania sp. SIO2C2 TaxID=2607787 RepID=UPI0013BE5DD3|nr:tetratricopeptide repeat-containing sulfotransferase family protein [Okeania sp. SIO2C2]NEP87856.1 tetratricopeptide repeat protein [Okeania sp. SIO2C2]
MGNKAMSAGQFLKQANQLKRAGRLDEAIALYHQAIEINPNFAWLHSNLGDALAQQNYFDEAVACFNQALEISSGTAFFYYQLSEAFGKQNKFNQALIYFDTLIKTHTNLEKLNLYTKGLNSNYFSQKKIKKSELWNALKFAIILEQRGEIKEAANLYKKIIEDSPYQYFEIYNKRGKLLLEMGERKWAVNNFEKAVFLNPNSAEYYLNLAEAVNRWSLSVKYYRTAVKLNPVALKKYYDTIKPNNSEEIKVKNPVFVVGCGHSGTSIMLALLGSHPSFYPIPYESAIFLHNLRKIEETMQNWDEECLAAGKSRWVEKTPPHIFQIGKFLKIRPQSRFILMLRDGRDVVCSLKDRPDSGYDKFWERLDRWIYDNLAGLLYWDDPRVKVVKYEDLVTNPEATLRNILHFLDEKYDDKILKFHQTERRWYSSEIIKPEKINSITEHKQYRNWQINQPLFDGRGRWKEEMTEGEKVIFKKKAQKYLLEFGYVEDDNW